MKYFFRNTLVLASFAFASSSARANDCETWQQIAPLPGPFFVKDMVQGGGVSIAVGNSGSILRAADGATWQTVQSPTLKDLNAVTWTGSAFVGVGNQGTVLTSVDGLDWVLLRSLGSTNTVYDVVWDGTRLLCLDRDRKLQQSTDGQIWSIVSTLPEWASQIEFLDGYLVATGGVNSVLMSSDGLT